MPAATEHAEQVVVIQWCDMKGIDIFAIPNGSNKSKASAGKFKAEGLRAGIPDLFIPIARNGYHGLFVEMKRIGGPKPSKAQISWLAKLVASGYRAGVCYGADEAMGLISGYLVIRL
jgi:hypothetical protein